MKPTNESCLDNSTLSRNTVMQIRSCLICAITALSGCGHPAPQFSIELDLQPNSNHPLSALANVHVSLDEADDETALSDISVEINFWADEEGVLLQNTGVQSAETPKEITLVGMRSETEYFVQAVASLGDDYITSSNIETITTGSLPEDISVVTTQMTDPDNMSSGFTIFGVHGSDIYSVAVDESGEVVWYYRGELGYTEATTLRDITLNDDGNLLVLLHKYVEIITPDGQPIKQIENNTGYEFNVHEMIMLPTGNFMSISQESTEVDGVLLRGNGIVEFDQKGELVWYWSPFDHLDTTRFPGEQSTQVLSNGALNWTHANALQYIEEQEAIIMSLRNQNQIIKIDHMTGDIIWHLGEEGDFELTHGEWFYSQHAPTWLPSGHISVYDNGADRPGDDLWSRGVVYELDETTMTASQVWEFRTEFFTSRFGAVEQLNNGNWLVAAGGPKNSIHSDAIIYEVTPEEQLVWSLTTTRFEGDDYDPNFYRASRIESFYPNGYREELR